jgi:flagellar motor switch protein FliG
MPVDLPAPFAPAMSHPAIRPMAASPSFATAPSGRRIAVLTGRQKAAILVRLLLVEGAELNLATLPEAMQAELTEQMAQMRLVDRDTLMGVVAEFVETLEQVGLSFPDGLDGALRALGGKLSPGATSRLRQMARASGHADPWDRIAAAEPEVLIDLLAPESIEVAAVVLSKLPVARAADLLGRMPGERARRVAFAISGTEAIAPQTVTRIGAALAAELDRKPLPAFPAAPAARVGAILNSVTADLRDSLLEGLDAADADFAQGVRKAIFTFGHLHSRVAALDVPKILRSVDQAVLVTALAAALPQVETDVGRSAEFLLASMSQRMSATLRDEIEGRGRVKPKDAEAAMAEVVASLRSLIDSGEVTLVEEEDAI